MRAAGARRRRATSSSPPATSATPSRSTCTSCSSRRATAWPFRRASRERVAAACSTSCSRCAAPTARCPRSATPTAAGSCRWSARAPDDCRGVFAVAAAMFDRADYAWAAGGPAPEALWLLGPTARDAFDALRPRPPRPALSALFADGGYAVMRSGWDRRRASADLRRRAARLPERGHGHADLLSIQCSAFGEPCHRRPRHLLLHRDPAWRDYFRSTAAHSTVTSTARARRSRRGPFAWHSSARARCAAGISTRGARLRRRRARCLRRLPDPVTPPAPRALRQAALLGDRRRSRRARRAPDRAAFPVRADLRGRRSTPTAGRERAGPEAPGCSSGRSRRSPLKARARQRGARPDPGWIAPDYGVRVPAPLLVYSLRRRLPLPCRRRCSCPPRTPGGIAAGRRPSRRRGQLVGLVFDDTGERFASTSRRLVERE